MIITISGKPGSGKTTIAKILAKKLKLKHYSTGTFRRKMARKLGLSLGELNKLGEKQDFTDKEADKWQTHIGDILPRINAVGFQRTNPTHVRI